MLPCKFQRSKQIVKSTPNTTLHMGSNPHQMQVVQTLIRKLLFSDCSFQSCFSKLPYNSWGKCCIQTGLGQSKQECLNTAECLKKTGEEQSNDQTPLTEKASFKKLQVLHEVLAHQDSDMNCQHYNNSVKHTQSKVNSTKNKVCKEYYWR